MQRQFPYSSLQAFKFFLLITVFLAWPVLTVGANTERVSVASDGTQGNDDSKVYKDAISADGRFVVFSSLADNLVTNDTNGVYDVFIHDRQYSLTERVSLASDGTEGNNTSNGIAISDDGLVVLFRSDASNLVSNDTNGYADIFVYERQTGLTERVNVATDGTQANYGSSGFAINADGRFVAFTSSADNLVIGDYNYCEDVFVHDRATGITERVSVASDGTEISSPGLYEYCYSNRPAISADGRYVAFNTFAIINPVPDDTNDAWDIYVHDRETGITERVSVDSNGIEANAHSYEPAISAAGRYVAFRSAANNLVIDDTNNVDDIFVHDRQTGDTERISLGINGEESNGDSVTPAISADGRYVLFSSTASNLVDTDINGIPDVFIYDRELRKTELISVSSENTQGNYSSTNSSVSSDGRFVAFLSWASTLVESDTNNAMDVFIRYRDTSELTPPITVSFGAAGTTYNPSGDIAEPINTATGNYYYQRTDLMLPGRGLGFVFKRTYNAQDSYSGPLGAGWTHSYNDFLTEAIDGSVIIKYGDGHEAFFDHLGAGAYVPRYQGVYDVLTKAPEGTFTLTAKNQTLRRFDATGRLVAVEDRNGNVLNLTYDTSGRLTSITDTVGRQVTLSYDVVDRIVQLLDPLGRTVSYAYDTNGDLVSVTDPAGNTFSYTYDAEHRITQILNPRGYVLVDNAYDALGRVVSQTNGRGHTTSLAYASPEAGDTSVTDPRGWTIVHTHDTQRRLIVETDALGNAMTYMYDDNNNRIQAVDHNGNAYAYTYDDRGNVLTKTDPLVNVTMLTYNATNDPLTLTDALGNTTAFEYDVIGNLISITDGLGDVSTFAYDGFGQLVAATDANGNTRTLGYDTQGNLIQQTDSLEYITAFEYDAVGRPTARTDANGGIRSYEYDNANNLTRIVDSLGNETQLAYDANNNLTSRTTANGAATAFSYDENDNLVEIVDALGNRTTYAYDANDNRTAVTDANGHTKSTSFDAADRVTALTDALGSTTQLTRDPNGNIITITDPLGNAASLSYDALDRLIATTDALSNVTTVGFDALGRRMQKTDALGRTTTYEYDVLGRLVRVIDPAGGQVLATYDAVGNCIALSGPSGNTSTYAFDANNRPIAEVDPLGYITGYDFDGLGNLITRTDSMGRTIEFTYDAESRLVTKQYPDSFVIQYEYDSLGNLIHMVDRVGINEYAYDPLNRLVQTTDPYAQTVTYEYDAVGKRIGLTYPDGKQVTYGYDARNRMLSVQDWLGYITIYEYDAAAQLTARDLPNDTSTEFAYDAAGRLTRLEHFDPIASVIAGYSLSLDPVGNRIGIDKIEPLEPILSSQTETYTYDAANRLLDINGQTVVHDDNGNMISRPGRIYTYDFDNRLTSVSGDLSAAYSYDGLGNRLEAQHNGVSTRYTLDLSVSLSQVLTENDSANSPSAYYVYGLGLLSRITPTGDVSYYHHDSRGNTVAMTDTVGEVTTAYAYSPFGKLLNASGSNANPFRFLGQFGISDEGGDLNHIRARYYERVQYKIVHRLSR